jgi:hypothetical protein
MKTLFSTSCLILCLLALAVGASAQQQLNFSQLPLVNTPTPMPNGYGQLSWGNFFYVDPFEWSGAGNGYKLGEQGEDVAFVGGAYCQLGPGQTECFGTLSDSAGFELVSARVAGGFSSASVTAIAYNNGVYVGTANFFVGTQMETLNFPSSWGLVTDVTLKVTGPTGDLVVYSLNLYTLIQDPPPHGSPVLDPPPPGN